MREDDLSIFRSPLVPDEDVRFVGNVDGVDDGDELADGLLCAANSVVGYVQDGVPSLTAPLAAPDGDNVRKWVDEARSENWIGRNWDRWFKGTEHTSRGPLRPLDREFARQLAETEGTVVEIAAGPGAGFTPGILLANRDARVLLNDVSIGILQLQREHMRREGLGPNVTFAAWDTTEHVLRPETVGAVSSWIGFRSTLDADRAIRAAFEALMAGGRLFMYELARGTDEMAALPKWIRERFELGGSWLDDLEEIGFQIENHDLVTGDVIVSESEEDDDLGADLARAGHTLHHSRDYIVARKPE